MSIRVEEYVREDGTTPFSTPKACSPNTGNARKI
jgi:hypothetical protein